MRPAHFQGLEQQQQLDFANGGAFYNNGAFSWAGGTSGSYFKQHDFATGTRTPALQLAEMSGGEALTKEIRS